jgi:hypothetical protein
MLSASTSNVAVGENTHGVGQISIKFNSGDPSWSATSYGAFVDWLKLNVEQKECYGESSCAFPSPKLMHFSRRVRLGMRNGM